jgi:hypothetical protein
VLGTKLHVPATRRPSVARPRLMERLGMRRELHAVRESLHRSGEWLDVYGYAMLACERHDQD